ALHPILFRRTNSPVIFAICILTTIAGTVPSILDIHVFNTFNYLDFYIGDMLVYLPYTNRTYMVLNDINNGHFLVMSAITLIANLILSLTLFRKSKEIASITNSRRGKQERGLMITSIVSYLFYMVYFVNSYIAREFEWTWSAFSQYLFLGISCHSPFWCLMIFSGSIRAMVLHR
ncbi:hypothetical protein PENTCL1PPCAC_29785, partial [Pristionchus entomophagus]